MSNKKEYICPVVGCTFIGDMIGQRAAWVAHMKDKHPEIKELIYAGEHINLSKEK